MANATKRRFDSQWATGLVLVGALGFALGVGLRAYQLPGNPTIITQVGWPPIKVLPIVDPPIIVTKGS